jgi:hypothetical protein
MNFFFVKGSGMMRLLVEKCLLGVLTLLVGAVAVAESAAIPAPTVAEAQLLGPANAVIAYPKVLQPIPQATGWVTGFGIDQPGAVEGLEAELIVGEDGDNNYEGWQHAVTATYVDEQDGGEAYVASMPSLSPGKYHYLFRFRFAGEEWTYGDLDGSENGIEIEQFGTLDIYSGVPPTPSLTPPPPTPTVTPSPTSDYPGGRDAGDFDGDDCTSLNDFLFLLDHWQEPVEQSPLGVGDFLNMLDYWQTGPGCS